MALSEVKRVLISVSNKNGLVSFVQELKKLGVEEILSTGGTAELLQKAGIKVTKIEDYTGFPEMMDGRVKTLHPKIYGGILAIRDNKKHLAMVKKHQIKLIDLVVVNLYPFAETIEKENVKEEEAIEQIDIGGPSLLRAAAKNFHFTSVLSHPKQYDNFIRELKRYGGISLETRRKLAAQVFDHLYRYDFTIADYLNDRAHNGELLDLHYVKVCNLRYGENPHQKAVFFRNPNNSGSNITNAQILSGKQLSFNNILDGNAAIELVREFEEPTVAVIKHTNPCGVASSKTIFQAFASAYEVDPMSAYGCVIAMNRPCDEQIADYIAKKKMFIEIIAASSFSKKALDKLKQKPNVRILQLGKLHLVKKRRDIKKVAGGILVQNADVYIVTAKDLKVVTKKKPTKAQIADLLFARQIVKHVKSNAVVFVKNKVTTGIGAGQMSRVDSVFIAGQKGGTKVPGSVMASDAFFPFPDGVEQAHKYGIKAIIQPGGSIRDPEVIKRADELGISMVFTGVRSFRH